ETVGVRRRVEARLERVARNDLVEWREFLFDNLPRRGAVLPDLPEVGADHLDQPRAADFPFDASLFALDRDCVSLGRAEDQDSAVAVPRDGLDAAAEGAEERDGAQGRHPAPRSSHAASCSVLSVRSKCARVARIACSMAGVVSRGGWTAPNVC